MKYQMNPLQKLINEQIIEAIKDNKDRWIKWSGKDTAEWIITFIKNRDKNKKPLYKKLFGSYDSFEISWMFRDDFKYNIYPTVLYCHGWYLVVNWWKLHIALHIYEIIRDIKRYLK